jgi:hypothetical protein
MYFSVYSRIYKSLICLGDVYRYKGQQSTDKSSDKWSESISWYKKALIANPKGGKPQSQLALISSTGFDYINAIYYYSLRFFSLNFLSCGNIETNPLLRKNFVSFISRSTDPLSVECVSNDDFSSYIMHFFNALLFPSQANIEKLKPLIATLTTYLETTMISGDILKKVTLSLLIMNDDLNNQFNSASKFLLIVQPKLH